MKTGTPIFKKSYKNLHGVVKAILTLLPKLTCYRSAAFALKLPISVWL